MAGRIDKTEAGDQKSFGEVFLEGENYTVMSLCGNLSRVRDDNISDMECCAPCPSYTTVPCSC